MRRACAIVLGSALAVAAGCVSDRDDMGPQGEVGGLNDTSADGRGDGDGPDGKFDTPDGNEGQGDAPSGCEKVDFLFVVDNSSSMADDQLNLTNSFPGFIATIENTINAQNYQIMVVDSDEWVGGGAGTPLDMSCQPAPSCCLNCAPPSTCNGGPCTGPPPPPPAPDPPPTPCDPLLGAGRNLDMYWQPCDFEGGNRYIVDGQADLEGTFTCAAMAGQWGDSGERPMQAMVEAVGEGMSGAGGCNEGFVRDDAILVVTFITDEPEEGGNAVDSGSASPGDPASWKQALVDAKHGNEEAIVVLGLIDDGNNTPGDVCAEYSGPFGGNSSPRLVELIESFGERGVQGSVCELDYTPFFESAVSVIDLTCEKFMPEG